MQLLPSIVVMTRRTSNDGAAIATFRRGAAALFLALAVAFTGCGEQAADSEPEAEALEEVARQNDEGPDDRVQVLDDERSVAGRVEDARIAAQIRLALVDADELRLFDFDPVVVNGQVLLRGEVQTRAQRERAASVAGSVEGVRDVVNEVSATEQPVLADADQEADTAAGTQPPSASDDTADVAARQEEPADEPAEPEEPADEPAQPEATHHTVRSGESLWTISRQYGVTIDQIKRLSNLRSNSIRPGQRLRVK